MDAKTAKKLTNDANALKEIKATELCERNLTSILKEVTRYANSGSNNLEIYECDNRYLTQQDIELLIIKLTDLGFGCKKSYVHIHHLDMPAINVKW